MLRTADSYHDAKPHPAFRRELAWPKILYITWSGAGGSRHLRTDRNRGYPERYYRALVIAKWTFPNHGGPGRPPLPTETVQAVLRIALENPRVGAPGIVRRLAAIGSTWNIISGNGPTPVWMAR